MSCRVAHLTSVHHAFDNRIFHKECKSLAAAGYQVTLIAPDENGEQIKDGIKLRAVRPPRDRCERLTGTIAAIYREAMREDAEIYHFHDPELMALGAVLKCHGKKVIYDVHEHYAGVLEGKEWLPRAMHRPTGFAINACEATLGGICDRIVAATPTIARKFRPARTRIVQNFPWLDEFRSADSVPYEQRKPIAMYIGCLADPMGVNEMAEAVQLAAKEVHVKLIMGGSVIRGAQMSFDPKRFEGIVECPGFLSRPSVAALAARAKLGLVLNHPTGNAVNAWPTKLFEYMAAGLPVIASDFPLYREIVESARCGLLANPLNPAEIAEAVVWLLRHPAEAAQMGRNGRHAVEEKYNWERQAKALVAVYAELESIH